MKKIILVLLSLFAFTVGAEYCDFASGTSVSLKADGSIKDGVVEKCFINAINRSGGTLAVGTVTVWETTEDDGASVTTSATAGAIPACILVESCADDAACKCQVSGLFDSVLFDSTNANATAGQSAYISENNAGYVQGESLGSVVATDVPVGVFYDSASASASVELHITLRR